jgi:putative hydrolase of the HAD superfamily
MEKDYLQYIREFLGESVLMKPAPTHLKPFVRKDTSIKAFVFDVYGTLLISASGDIDESVISTDNVNQAFQAAGIEIANGVVDSQQLLTDIIGSFRQSVRDFHENERTEEKPYPEIDILKVWEEIIIEYAEKERIKLNGPLCIKCFTFVFEVLSNRIYPMPGMKEVIEQLHHNGYPLGIISNAQFYTPVILNFFLHNTISEAEEVPPFDPGITVFSYKYKRSKPDSILFERVKEQCRKQYNLFADEILFIGNDMYRDIYPASLAGFKTALFAGDTKSLKLRQEKQELKKVVPDFIVTDLRQILSVMA